MRNKYDVLEWVVCGMYFAGWLGVVIAIICN